MNRKELYSSDAGREDDKNHRKDSEREPRVTLLTVIKSVLAAAIGVQSDVNRMRDLQHHSPVVFIAVGLLLTVLFVLTMVGIVTLVVPD